jgi:TonB family protein
MRLVTMAGLLGLLGLLIPQVSSGGDSTGDFYARVRANDAPLGGRFTIFVYALDSLDAAVERPGPGRLLLLNFSEANGDDSFIIPADLSIKGPRNTLWTRGFLPIGDKRLDGLLAKDESRWAIWWLPAEMDSVGWELPQDLTIHYGYAKSIFVPLQKRDLEKALAAVPWESLAGVQIEPDRPVGELLFPPDPAAFDNVPQAKERSQPAYPKSSRMYAFEGSVITVAVVNAKGTVDDVFVLHSDATHDLNVSALSAVRKWVFKAGRKGGIRVRGEMVIPVHFSMGSVKKKQ